MSWKDAAAAMTETAVQVFGEEVTFFPKAGGGPHVVEHAVFSKDYVAVDPDAGVPISTVGPNLGVVLSKLPTPPVKGDSWTVGGVDYRCTDVQPDSEDHAIVILQEK